MYGSVRSSTGQEPVEFAYIHLEEVRRTAISDIQGHFKLLQVPAGHHTIHITRIGFEPLLQVIDLTAGDSLNLELVMRPETIEAGQLTIEADRMVGSALGV